MKPICRNCVNFYGDHRKPKVLRDGIGFCKVSPLEPPSVYDGQELHHIWPAVDDGWDEPVDSVHFHGDGDLTRP